MPESLDDWKAEVGCLEMLSAPAGADVADLLGEPEAATGGTQELHECVDTMQAELERNLADARQAAARLQGYVERQRAVWAEKLFKGPHPCASVAALRDLVEGFTAKCEAEEAEREAETKGLKELVESLRGELEAARLLKSQEERDLVEFKSLRAKESELQDCSLQLSQLRSEVEELRAAQAVHAARAAQSEAALGESTRKVVELARQLDERSEQCRLLSDENVTLRLQLGREGDAPAALEAPADPLAHGSADARLSGDLQQEEQRFRDELAMAQFKFPGLAVGSDNCRSWCSGYLGRQCDLYRSFLHLLQDLRQEFPAGAEIEFISKTQAVGSAWNQREEEMRGADAAFHEREKAHTKHWEDRRLQLTAERDAKIRQLLEQGEKSQSKAEKQLLMQQAKLFGQRLDAQIERAWEEQRQERDARWTDHSRAKQESRQRLKDESLSVQQSAEGAASAADRFQDMARAKLASAEDAWLRNLEKASEVSGSALRHGDLLECLQAAGLPAPSIPAEGSSSAGTETVASLLEEIVDRRMECRTLLEQELEDQTLQQLRVCVEAFLQKETSQHHPPRGPGGPSAAECARAPDFAQAAAIRSLLHARQHRVVADTIRRQFGDFLLVLRAATLGAAWLLPGGPDAASIKQRGVRLDLPRPSRPQAADGAVEVGASGCSTYEELLLDLLGRLVEPLRERHREELLGLKRTHAREVRSALEHLCQLEPEDVERARRLDLEEYQHQVKSKLLTDCQSHLAEEQRQLLQRVDAELEAHSQAYRLRAGEEERAVLAERKRWLAERLVVVESQASICPGDRAMIHRLRAEQAACEDRLDVLAREAESQPPPPPPPWAIGDSRPVSPPSPCWVQVPGLGATALPAERQAAALLSASQPRHAGAPPSPGRPLPTPRGPGAGGSRAPSEAAASSETARRQPALATPRGLAVAAGRPLVSPEIGGRRSSEPSMPGLLQPRPPPPPDGLARGAPAPPAAPGPSAEASGTRLLSEDLLSMAVDAHPVYGSPFAASAGGASSRSLSAPVAPLPPLRHPPQPPGPSAEQRYEPSHAASRPFSPLTSSGAQSARQFQPRGPGLGAPAASSGAQSARSLRPPPTPPPAAVGGKSARAVPPLLPPMRPSR